MTKVSIALSEKRGGLWVVTYDGAPIGDDRAYRTWELAWDEAGKRVANSPTVFELVTANLNDRV